MCGDFTDLLKKGFLLSIATILIAYSVVYAGVWK